jgi:hypothetical protein
MKNAPCNVMMSGDAMTLKPVVAEK